MNRFENSKVIGERRKNIVESLYLDRLTKYQRERVLQSAINQGFNMDHWYTRTNVNILVSSSKAVKTNLIKENKDWHMLNCLINTWEGWMTDNA